MVVDDFRRVWLSGAGLAWVTQQSERQRKISLYLRLFGARAALRLPKLNGYITPKTHTHTGLNTWLEYVYSEYVFDEGYPLVSGH